MTFIRTTQGRNLPVSLRTEPITMTAVDGTEKVLGPSLITVDGEQWAMPHFWDCPQGKQWSQRSK